MARASILLDTNVLIRVLECRTNELPTSMAEFLDNPTTSGVVSTASTWEIAVKHRLGKLPLSVPLEHVSDQIYQMNLRVLGITLSHSLAKLEMEPPTNDPFDRLLLAVCQLEDLRLMTLDKALISHPLAWRP